MNEIAAACIGVGILFGLHSWSEKMNAKGLARIAQIDELKGLGDLLEKEPLCNPIVAIFGTVGSNSAVETTRSGALCVFSEETATINYNCTDSERDSKRVMLYSNEVSWYLDDGTTRVSVTGAKFAMGFYDTLNKYVFTEPVMEHFERFFSSKDVKFVPKSCCERVLEIGKPLMVIGKAERDKHGAPTIGRVYKVSNERIDFAELVSDLKSKSERCRKVFLWLTGIGVSILAVSVLIEFSK
ncbi:unnamed protein product [Eruca vesicaria subsp. sativa]|uniref:RING-type E3 ubiquitin transferase n=1 Tax=Eruca vesicaria subsp. sativa TaxID=29727 RepID=A0ABC8M6H9_ERUVS|nr:unnamed protein product [Eruca vesicaria subsp. sativa]